MDSLFFLRGKIRTEAVKWIWAKSNGLTPGKAFFMPDWSLSDQVSALQRVLDDAGNCVFFGGAGVSTESGLPDFRSPDGLYRKKFEFSPEVMLSHDFFMHHPDAFYEFYRSIIIRPDIRPNPTHFKLAELEKRDRLQAVITQNIDGLHQMAGSVKVLELHGSIYRNYCLSCHKAFSIDRILNSSGTPLCSCGGLIRPDIVLYEEGLNAETLHEAVYHIRHADTLIVGGTSLSVYPAAGLIDYFQGRHLVLINKEATFLDNQAELVLPGPIGAIMAKILIRS